MPEHPLLRAASPVREVAFPELARLNLLTTEGAVNFFRRNPNAGRGTFIGLPHGEFMLRFGDDVFSSLQPDKQVKIINRSPILDLYEHDNYIINTVGLNPDGSFDDWSTPQEGIRNNQGGVQAGINTALVAHYGIPDEKLLIGMYNRAAEQSDWSASWPYSGHGPYYLERFVEETTDPDNYALGSSRWLLLPRREVSLFDNFRQMDVEAPDFEAGLTTGRDVAMGRLSEMGAGWLNVPTGRHGGVPVEGEGIIQVQQGGLNEWADALDENQINSSMRGMNTWTFAYINGKQVVQSPEQVVPALSRYSHLPVPGLSEDLWNAIPWHGRYEPTWMLAHVRAPKNLQ